MQNQELLSPNWAGHRYCPDTGILLTLLPKLSTLPNHNPATLHPHMYTHIYIDIITGKSSQPYWTLPRCQGLPPGVLGNFLQAFLRRYLHSQLAPRGGLPSAAPAAPIDDCEVCLQCFPSTLR